MHACRRLAGSTLLVLALLLPGRISAQEHAPEHDATRTEQAAEHAGTHGQPHQVKTLDNWFSLSFGPGKEKENGPLAFSILNFVVLLGLLVRFARKPLQSFLQQRHQTIRKDLDEAAALHRQAKEKLDAIDARLRNLDREIAEMKTAVAKDAEEEKQRIVKTAEAEAQRIMQQTEEILKRELRNAQRRLELEAVESAIRAAEKLIRQSLTDEDRRRLNDDYYKQLAS